ncbi:hypothetical protein N7465_008933 [Penicillium sp. CMV-2018d]|nr:hypothetical protein N7465_008933 [Penicillium sp. CMV-2018d]
MRLNTPNVFRGTCQVTIVPKRLATCRRTHTRKPGLIWMLSCMGLNDVDVSCIGTRVATGPSPYAVSEGLRPWTRVGPAVGWTQETRSYYFLPFSTLCYCSSCFCFVVSMNF